MDITEKRMPGIGKEDLLIPVDLTLQHPGFLKAVQFLADSIGAFAEFSLKIPQIRPRRSVQEELYEKLDAGFGGDEGF